MTDNEVDSVLKWAAGVPHEVDGAVVERVSKTVLPALRPVKPLPSELVVTVGLAMIFFLAATLGATYLGFNGSRVLSDTEKMVIFWVAAVLAGRVATSAAATMAPGSKNRFDPRILLAICTGACVAVFASLFYDYRLDRFFSEGMNCLGAGLLEAAAAGILLWLVVRRGVILDPPAAGLAVGTLAGLTGFAMLEMHCPILKAMHLMVWHTAVIPLSGLVGYLVGRFVQERGNRIAGKLG